MTAKGRRETSNATPSGARLVEYDELPSTSEDARKRIERGETGPVWIVALLQTDGYGRRGRKWFMEKGDFAATFFFHAPGPQDRLPELSFVAALSVYEALERECDAARLSVKWPNDILIDGKKAGGLLLERFDTETGPLLSLGIGINIVSKPPEGATPYKTARLADAIDPARGLPDPYDLVCAIDGHLLSLIALWTRSGFAPIREAWMERAHGFGSEVEVKLPRGVMTGLFGGIDGSGRLILNPLSPDDPVRRIDAGEVFFASEDAADGPAAANDPERAPDDGPDDPESV